MGVVTRTRRPRAASLVGWLSVLGALGAAAMTLAHLGLEIPVVSELGPARLILPAAISFAVVMVLYVLVAIGAFRLRRWAWTAGVLVNAAAFLGAAFPYRGVESGVAMAVSLLALVVLFSGSGRRAFRSATAST